MNKAPGLPLTIGLMGELVLNAKLGHKVAAEGFRGPALDPFPQGRNCKISMKGGKKVVTLLSSWYTK